MKRLVIFFCALLFAYTLYGQGVTINGKLLVTPAGKNEQVWFATLLIIKNEKVIASTSVDTSCYFRVNINGLKLKEDSTNADIGIVLGWDTLYVKPITLIPNSTINCDIELPNKYNKNVLGDVICPRCNKTHYVVPIRRGTIRAVEMHIKNGDTTYTPSSKEYFISGDASYDFDAFWYCKKCNIKF